MLRNKFLILAACLLMTTSLMADDLQQDQQTINYQMQINDFENYQRLQEIADFNLVADFNDFPIPQDIFDVSYRSPGRAFFYSLMVPGGGQLYTASKTKATIFILIEAVSWFSYFNFHSDGQTKEDAYIEYADKNWDPNLYTDWLVDTYEIIDDDDRTEFSHHLPDVKSQQYYEMIGKYEQFRYGWTDTDYTRGDSSSSFRDDYLIDRSEANDAFDKAKLFVIIAMGNHLFSAFEGALSAKKYNRKRDAFTQVGLNAGLLSYEGKKIPQLKLTYKFF